MQLSCVEYRHIYCGITRTQKLVLAFGAERLTCFAISVMSSWPCPCVFSALPQYRSGQACFLLAPWPHRFLSGRLTHTRGSGRQNFTHGEIQGRRGVHLAGHQLRSATSSLGVQEASDASIPSDKELAGGVREGETPCRPWTCLGTAKVHVLQWMTVDPLQATGCGGVIEYAIKDVGIQVLPSCWSMALAAIGDASTPLIRTVESLVPCAARVPVI